MSEVPLYSRKGMQRVRVAPGLMFLLAMNVDIKLDGKREFKLQWREAGPPNHLDGRVDSDK